MCSEQDVKGYPTLKVFRSGAASEYKGPRKADGIVSYMKKWGRSFRLEKDCATIDKLTLL